MKEGDPMANDISALLNTKLRFSGLASGLDTDLIVKQLMRAETMKLDKIKQDKQLLEWRRDKYRDITNLVRGFKDSYFDVLKPETNFRSPNAFAAYDISSGDPTVVTAKAGSGAASAIHEITVRKLATAAKIEKIAPDYHVTGDVSGSMDIEDFDLLGNQIKITYDGMSKVIELENYVGGDSLEKMAEMRARLQSAIDDAFGTGKINVASNGARIGFNALVNGSIFTLSDISDGQGLEKLGFTAEDNKSNRISLDSKLASIENSFSTAVDFDPDADVSFTINGVDINLNKKFTEASIRDVINAVNTSSANVELKYDSLRDRFSLTSKVTGDTSIISIVDTDAENGLFKALGIEMSDFIAGEDAEFDLDGVTGMKRSTNEFFIDGISYSLKGASNPPKAVTISVKANTDTLITKIKDFVEKYNELIGKINTQFSDKYDKNYLPLTDEQKESMKDVDITKWEEKAQKGLLHGDKLLSNIIDDMRRALYDPIEGVAVSLYKIGITTGSYEQKGKLIIDENKLRESIENSVDSVTQLFTQSSDISYNEALSDPSKNQVRYGQLGLGQRLYDIIENNIRTIRDDKGYKGALLEKAGITGDISEFKNTVSEEIKNKEILIDILLNKLIAKEDILYKKFAVMEKALSQMNNQSGWLMQQLGVQGQ